MYVFLGLTGFIGIIVAIARLISERRNKEKKKIGKNIFVVALFLFVLGIAITPTEDKEVASDSKKVEVSAPVIEKPVEKMEVKKEEVVLLNWQDKVTEVAAIDGSPTDKYDAIMLYAKEYPSTEAEIKEFEEYIIAEYQSKNYLADINNSEYMLSNIFRANVINRFYGEVNTPINEFIFDFYQNTKYTYRGVDTIDNAATRANERQMDKKLAEIK